MVARHACRAGIQSVGDVVQWLIVGVLFTALILAAILNSKIKEWVHTHASAAWILGVLVAGGLCLYVAHQLSASAPQPTRWLETFGTALITAAFTAVFFSLPDTANQLSGIVAGLLRSGQIDPSLSNESKTRIERRLRRSRLRLSDAAVHPAQDHVEQLLDQILQAPYFTAYNYSVNLEPVDGDESHVWSHTTVTAYMFPTLQLRIFSIDFRTLFSGSLG